MKDCCIASEKLSVVLSGVRPCVEDEGTELNPPDDVEIPDTPLGWNWLL